VLGGDQIFFNLLCQGSHSVVRRMVSGHLFTFAGMFKDNDLYLTLGVSTVETNRDRDRERP
jgi:hypothetical protein